MASEMNDGFRRVARYTARAYGIYLIIGSLACGAMSWVVLHFLAKLAADQDIEVPGLALALIENRVFVPLIALPAFLCGIIVVGMRGRRSLGLVLIGTLFLLAPLALSLYCFLALIAPMYQYKAL
jgi:hypothetical protein